MQTNFTKKQLQDSNISSADGILRKCVHCGFCNATCPTYQIVGDELDGPRGRIYLIKDMLENDKPANEKIAKHIDRCLSCYACMTTCPSGVNYGYSARLFYPFRFLFPKKIKNMMKYMPNSFPVSRQENKEIYSPV